MYQIKTNFINQDRNWIIMALPYFSLFDKSCTIPQDDLFDNATPIWFHDESKNNKAIVICLHGFTATPFEAIPVAKAIYKKNIDALCPLFPAHGWKNIEKAKKAMSKLTISDLINAIKFELENVRKEYDNIFLYGQSLGGLIALAIAEKVNIDGLALTAPALKISKRGERAGRYLGWLNIHLDKSNEKKGYFNETYSFRSTRTIRRFNKFASKVKNSLKDISCSVLTCHSKNDTDVLPITTEWIQNLVSGPVQINWYNHSGHTLALDVQGKQVCHDIAEFFSTLIN